MSTGGMKRPGQIVQERREYLGLERAAIADRADYSSEKLRRMEEGEIPMKRAHLEDLVMAGLFQKGDEWYVAIEAAIAAETGRRRKKPHGG